MGWDGVSDFYEDDEPVERIEEIAARPPDAITRGHDLINDPERIARIRESLQAKYDPWAPCIKGKP